MKVAVFETEEWEHRACLRLQGEHAVVCTREALSEGVAGGYADAEIVSPFVKSRLKETRRRFYQYGARQRRQYRRTGARREGGQDRRRRLDVLPQEPLLRDEAAIFRGGQYSQDELSTLLASNVLLRFPNVLVTPHITYNTEDAVRRIIETTLANVQAFARGTAQNVVS